MKRPAKPQPQPAPPTPSPSPFELKEQIRKQQEDLEAARKAASEADGAVRARSEALRTTQVRLQAMRDQALLGVLSPEVIDAFAPEHTRRSCSDENVHNAWGCPRCSLLEAKTIGYIDFDYKFEVQRRCTED